MSVEQQRLSVELCLPHTERPRTHRHTEFVLPRDPALPAGCAAFRRIGARHKCGGFLLVQLKQLSGLIRNIFFSKSVLAAVVFIRVGEKRGEWQIKRHSFANLKNI